jgi:site-specific DNA recombinase
VGASRRRPQCLRWAKDNGYTVPETWIVEDRGYSGAEENRPGLQRRLRAARKKAPFAAIIALDHTRFSRSEELFYWLRRECRKADVQLISATEHGEIELLTGVKAIIGAGQRRQIATRTTLAMRYIARQGHWCGGRAPFGYKRKETPSASGNKQVVLKPNSDTAPVVRRLFQTRAKGASLRDLAHKLNEDGIPGPSGGAWRAAAIVTILKNPVYIGQLVYNRTRKVGRNPSRVKHNPPSEWIITEGAHKAIVDRKTWDTVQAAFRDGSPTKKLAHTVHPLSGLVYCGVCDSKYHPRGARGGGAHACAKRKEEGPQACDNSRVVSRRALEQKVNDFILEALEWPENSEALYQSMKNTLDRRRQAARKAGRSSDLVHARRELKKAEKELQKHLDFIAKVGSKAPASLAEQISRLERRIAALRIELQPPRTGKMDLPSKEEISEYLSHAARALERGDATKRREIYRALIKRVVISPKSIRMEGNKSGGNSGGRNRWCRGRDSNPHGVTHTPLKRTCLPNSTTPAYAADCVRKVLTLSRSLVLLLASASTTGWRTL